MKRICFVVMLALFASTRGGNGEVQELSTWFTVGDVIYPGLEQNADKIGRQMARVLAENPVSKGFLLGDICNDLEPSDECYERLYATAWGTLMPQLRAVVGNHDSGVGLAKVFPPFFRYVFNTDREGLGYFDFQPAKGWLGIGLNIELMLENNGNPILEARRQAQLDWFEQKLHEYYNSECIVVFMHRPPYSSGDHAGKKWTDLLFRMAYKYGVDLIVAGHEHFAASLPPLGPGKRGQQGVLDSHYGIPILIFGTGGAILFPRPEKLLYGETVVAGKLGIGRIDLGPKAWRAEFLPENPNPMPNYPFGSGTCHDNPPGFVE